MALNIKDPPPSYEDIMTMDKLNTSVVKKQHSSPVNEKSLRLHKLIDRHEKAIREGINLGERDITSERLAKHYYNVRDFGQALQYFEKQYTVCCTMYGFDSGLEKKAQVMDSIAFCFKNLEETKEAENWFMQASDLRQRTVISEAAAFSYHKKAREYEHNGQWEEALHYYQKELEARKHLTPTIGTEQKASILHRMGVIYRKLCHFQKSLAFFHKAYDMAITTYGTKRRNKCVGACLSEIAHSYYKMENYSLARQFWLQSLKEFVGSYQTVNPTHHIISETYQNIGIASESAGDYKLAETNYREAWTLGKRRCGTNRKDNHMIRVYRDLIRVLKVRGKETVALAIQREFQNMKS